MDGEVKPGPRDHLVTREIQSLLDDLDPAMVDRRALDATEAPRRLAHHVARVVERELRGGEEGEAARQAESVNKLLPASEAVLSPPELWTGLRAAPTGLAGESAQLVVPATPFGVSDLLVNGDRQPSFGSELRAELATADSVDLICAFVIWSGVVHIREALAGVVARGGRVRVITTTYMGATQPRALDELLRVGAEVRVAYAGQSTKLHAKSWLLERESGLTTAYVGSSNLSHTALVDGLEWNVRLSAVDAPHLIDRIRATFDTYWEEPHFEPYASGDAERLKTALGSARDRDPGSSIAFTGLDVRPWPHQERILEKLDVERKRHNRHKNLVVAATGTGKTVVAALDYRSLCEQAGHDLSLLFVAHRKRILEQSLGTFRHAMRDGSFGEIHGGGSRADGRHVFAMIQLLRDDALERLPVDYFDVVIIDEFHHAAAPSYRALLEHVEPTELLGLTATPERADDADVTQWFGGRIAFEMRLWEAIEDGFLVPFQYFGVSDGTDLSTLQWDRGGYRMRDLEAVFVGDDARVVNLLAAINRFVPEPSAMRALGFCVSVQHAHYMARRFSERGLPSVAIDGSTADDERRRALKELERGDLRCIFSVDVLGEGVDVPTVDTVLLLRPTDSATVFTQQLGRGLRRAPRKPYLTVIDLIGQQHRRFRFDRRLTALLDARRAPITEQVEHSFPFLPAGCQVTLDRRSTQIVLASLKDAARLGQWTSLINDLRAVGDVGLHEFLRRTERTTADMYGRGGERSWTRLRRDAGLPTPTSKGGPDEEVLLRAMARLQHVDDPERVERYREMLSSDAPPDCAKLSGRQERLLTMLHFGVWGTRRKFDSLQDAMDALWPHAAVRHELCELFDVAGDAADVLPYKADLPPEVPLLTHARYGRDEILSAYGVGSPASPPHVREGVKYVKHAHADLFFVTLRKSEAEYSPTTMYRDYAISRTLFHWESQVTQRFGSPSVQRYINHREGGSDVLLFVRDRKVTSDGLTAPYWFLGKANFVSATGDRPVAFKWELERPMPEQLFEVARTIAAV